MILEGLVCLMRWKYFLLKSPKLFISLLLCWPMVKALSIFLINRYLFYLLDLLLVTLIYYFITNYKIYYIDDFTNRQLKLLMNIYTSKILHRWFYKPTMQIFWWIILFQLGSNDLIQQAHIFLYANGKKNPPTAVDYDRSLLRDFIFHKSPPKVNLNRAVTVRFDYWIYLDFWYRTSHCHRYPLDRFRSRRLLKNFTCRRKTTALLDGST